MRGELRDLLTAYLAGWKSIIDCAEWLASLRWDDPGLDAQTRAVAGSLELVATEVMEGIRPESDFWREAADYVAGEKGSIPIYAMQSFSSRPSISGSANDSMEVDVIGMEVQSAPA
jgi:hypothetical protein